MFDSDTYTVKQKILSFHNRYNIYEGDELVLKSKQKIALKEDFKFYDQEENPVLHVTTDQILDVAASYTVKDARNGETVGALKRNFTFLRHEWELIDSENRVIGTIKEDNMLLALMRRFVTSIIPFSYRIESQDGGKLGDLKGRLKLRDVYNLDLTPDDDERLDRRLAVAAAVLVDAIEKN